MEQNCYDRGDSGEAEDRLVETVLGPRVQYRTCDRRVPGKALGLRPGRPVPARIFMARRMEITAKYKIREGKRQKF